MSRRRSGEGASPGILLLRRIQSIRTAIAALIPTLLWALVLTIPPLAARSAEPLEADPLRTDPLVVESLEEAAGPDDSSDGTVQEQAEQQEEDFEDAERNRAAELGEQHRPLLWSGPPPPVGLRLAEPLEGERVRLSYRFERIHFRGMLVGDRHRSPSQVRDRSFWNYTKIPRRMDVTVHTFELAVAPHPRVTLVAELPFIQRELQRWNSNDMLYERQTEGIGDFGLFMVVPFIRKGREASSVHLGFNAPTGSIRRGDGNGERAPYDLQIGGGTWALEWGWSYRGEWERMSWGMQAVGNHPVNRNGLHYRLGSHFEASMWSAVDLIAGVSASLRFSWDKQNNISGQDRALDPISEPSANSKARGGTRLDLSPGLAFEIPRLKGQRISAEVAVPVYQNLDGPQLERDWAVEVGWQWVF